MYASALGTRDLHTKGYTSARQGWYKLNRLVRLYIWRAVHQLIHDGIYQIAPSGCSVTGLYIRLFGAPYHQAGQEAV